MRREDIKVGDRLRIREWDDMEREFGVHAAGWIRCKNVFAPQMRPLCGAQFTVAEIESCGSGSCIYHSVEGVENPYFISADMLEPDDIIDSECSSDDFDQMLCDLFW